MAKTMAAVLAEHRINHQYDTTLHEQCICGRRWMMGPQAFENHQAAALSAAGYGLVADAKREAWAEGHRAGWNDRDDDAQSGWVPSGYSADTDNPYREASNDDQ